MNAILAQYVLPSLLTLAGPFAAWIVHRLVAVLEQKCGVTVDAATQAQLDARLVAVEQALVAKAAASITPVPT